MMRSALLLAGVLWFLLQAVPVFAHTEFQSSTPTDGDTVDSPVSDITVVFTMPVTIVGNGFEVLDPGGNVLNPTVETSDGTTFTLVLPEPLEGGDVGVRYEVAAEDGHVLAGGFAFTVTSSRSATTTSTTIGTTTGDDDAVSSTIGPTTTTVSTNTSVADGDDEGAGSIAPLWLGLGAVVVGGLGLYARRRSRS